MPTVKEIEADLADDGTPRAISINADGSIETVECHGLDNARQVFFYEQDFYVLSNFSAFRIYWRGRDFDTSEAAYHWTRFATGSCAYTEGEFNTGLLAVRLDTADMIRFASSAHEAFRLAQDSKRYQRDDWDAVKVDIMRDILREKAKQHEYVSRKLLATGERELIENSWRDNFWGWGPNQDGQNVLGRLWMEVREELRVTPRALEQILSDRS